MLYLKMFNSWGQQDEEKMHLKKNPVFYATIFDLLMTEWHNKLHYHPASYFFRALEWLLCFMMSFYIEQQRREERQSCSASVPADGLLRYWNLGLHNKYVHTWAILLPSRPSILRNVQSLRACAHGPVPSLFYNSHSCQRPVSWG